MRQKVLIAPLLLAVALSMIAMPLAMAQPMGPIALESYGKGYAKVSQDWRSELGWLECGEAWFGYCHAWGYAWLEFGCSGADAIYEIDYDTLRESSCLTTFKAGLVPIACGDIDDYNEPDGCSDYGWVDSELCTGKIRVVVFLKGDDNAFVVVYGWGVKYIGCGTVCYLLE